VSETRVSTYAIPKLSNYDPKESSRQALKMSRPNN